MRLTRIKLRSWMPFDDVDLDLTDVSSVVVVGENGAGKSALLDAITWALYDRTRQPGGGEGSSPDKLIHVGADMARVHIEWRTGEHLFGLTRERFSGREGKLRLTVDGVEESHHTIADTRAAAIRYAGLAFAPMIAGPLMVQAGLYPATVADSLLRASPSGRKDIMLEVFGSTEWQPLHERAKGERDLAVSAVAVIERRNAELEQQAEGQEAVETELVVARQRVADCESKIAETDEEIAKVRERAAVVNASAERLSGLRRDIDQLMASVVSDQNVLERQQAIAADSRRAASAPEPPPAEADPSVYDEALATARAELDESAKARAALTEQVGIYTTLRMRVDAYERAAADYESTVSTVPCGAEGIFATCRFLTGKPDPASVAAEREELPKRQAEMERLQPIADDYDRRADAVARVEVDQRRAESAVQRAESAKREWAIMRSTAKERMDGALAEVDRLADRIAATTTRLAEATAERERLVAEAGEVEHLGREQARLAALRSAALGAKQEAERPVRQLEVQLLSIQRAKEGLVAGAAELQAARDKVRVYTDLTAAFHRDGIPTMLIEEAIPSIEANANEVLARMPGDLSLTLVTGRVTDAGSISDRLDIVVSDAGYERDHVMLSIGQRFRVDLALRVAVGRVLAHRSGISVRTLWLDEPLANLDAPARQAVVETLAAIQSEFGLIVVVSHSPDVNHAFSHRIEVERQGATSTAVLV
jgi:exonuclease SbcC